MHRQLSDVKVMLLKGETGTSIVSIEKTSTYGNVDTYTISMSDGGRYTFQVTNGTNGQDVSLANLAYVQTTLVATKDFGVGEHIAYDTTYYVVTQRVLEGGDLIVGTNIVPAVAGDEIQNNKLGIDGFQNATTEFNNDGSITETYGDRVKTTVFNQDGSITETLKKSNVVYATKNTVFNNDGSITETIS